jgi:uncharacterized protein (DUF2235 family)
MEACHSKLLQHRYQRAAVGASRRRVHRPTALWSALDADEVVVSSSTLRDQEGVRERAHDVGSVGTDARASAIMLTSGFRASWRSRGAIRCAEDASPWVPPTGRERMLSHMALQWSLVTRDPHRDTL